MITSLDPAYDDARRVFNGRIDRYPAVIARCERVGDVRAAVDYAIGCGLPLAVRGGGHSLGGHAIRDGALVIEVSAMRQVRIDVPGRRVAVEAGVTWAQLDAATHAHGLAVTGGRTSSIGVAGFTLGGGSGWLERQYGLTSDNLVRAEVVTAGGRRLSASEDEHPDLFWALRGGVMVSVCSPNSNLPCIRSGRPCSPASFFTPGNTPPKPSLSTAICSPVRRMSWDLAARLRQPGRAPLSRRIALPRCSGCHQHRDPRRAC